MKILFAFALFVASGAQASKAEILLNCVPTSPAETRLEYVLITGVPGPTPALNRLAMTIGLKGGDVRTSTDVEELDDFGFYGYGSEGLRLKLKLNGRLPYVIDVASGKSVALRCLSKMRGR